MDEEIVEEFNEKFATIEDALKYIADSQAKTEFASRRAAARHDKEIAEIRALQDQTEQNLKRTEQNLDRTERNLDRTERNLDRIQQHLSHITKVLRFNIEEYEFQDEKLTEAGKILSSKRTK